MKRSRSYPRGSKRIPRKNIREFHGKPIIAYSIEMARRLQCFARIVVSTDDEIAAVAQRFGAETPFMRPCVACGRTHRRHGSRQARGRDASRPAQHSTGHAAFTQPRLSSRLIT
jgi:CMP-2-keto-3-deoxyoctulosonic acid synthetase